MKEQNPWLMEVDKFALEDAVNRVNDAYKNFFEKRARFPKHASKSKPQGNTYTTHFTNGNIAVIKDASGIPCIKLPKLGLVRFVLPKGTKFKDLVPEFTHILKVTVRREGKRYIASLPSFCSRHQEQILLQTLHQLASEIFADLPLQH